METKREMLHAINQLEAAMIRLQNEVETSGTRRRWNEYQKAEKSGGDSWILAFNAGLKFYQFAIPALVELSPIGTLYTWTRALRDSRSRQAACAAALADLKLAEDLLSESGSRVSKATATLVAERMASAVALVGANSIDSASANH